MFGRTTFDFAACFAYLFIGFIRILQGGLECLVAPRSDVFAKRVMIFEYF